MEIALHEIEPWLIEHQFAPYNLGESGMLNRTLGELLADVGASIVDLADVSLGNSDTRGDPALRAVIASLYPGATADDVLVTTGTSEALWLYAQVRHRAGANVVVPVPAFQSLFETPRYLGYALREVPLRHEDGFRLDPAAVARAIDADTRTVVLNNPQNPTGAVLSRDDVEAVRRAARAHGAEILADEHYRFMPLDGTALLPTLWSPGGDVVAVGSMIKCFGCVGLRIGWMLGPRPLLDACRDLKDYTTHTVCAVNERVARLILARWQDLAPRYQAWLRANVEAFDGFVRAHADRISWVPPRGGLVAFPRLDPTRVGETAPFVRALVRDTGSSCSLARPSAVGRTCAWASGSRPTRSERPCAAGPRSGAIDRGGILESPARVQTVAMQRSAAITIALLLAVGAPLAWAYGNHAGDPPPPVGVAPTAPEIALLEGDPAGEGSAVVLRQGDRARVLGRVPHAAGGARKGTLLQGGAEPRVAVVVQEHPSRGASTYDSALYLVDARGARRLFGEVTNASRPLRTRSGRLLVQRGEDGESVEPVDRALRERRDALRIDAVDPLTGAHHAVWSGHGQIAFLGCALEGDEALLWHLDGAEAELLALDAGRGVTRRLRADLHLARDFSFDRGRGEVVFAQADGPEVWTLRALSLRDLSLRTLYTATSDHLMPAALGDGRVALSLPDDRGLATLSLAAMDTPRRLAPLGDGSDAVLHRHGDWIALRHSEMQREVVALTHLPTRASVSLPQDDLVRDVLGFTEAP
ncbi:MAG: aminotransferase class I/II-fold pyridoxal phosphate-dependent enzyme [Polyangiales bacterium]